MIRNWWKIINGIAVDVIVADEWIASLPESELWSDEPNCIGCAESQPAEEAEQWIVDGRTVPRS
jgi:hypothetical protein